MYPRNSASPEPIAIGPVILIADGTVQTSAVTVRIKPIGVAEADGLGTTAYSTDGIVFYTPTQAETNYTSFILIAKKASCIPVAITIITTASATPGTVLLAPVTHTSAVVPNVTLVDTTTTNTDMRGTDSALASLGTNAPTNWINAAAIAEAALNGKGDWNIGKTGYGLTPEERTALATLIDATLLDAGDATDLIASIVTRIGNTNVDEASFVAAVKAALFDVASAANKLSVNASGEVVASNMRGTDNAMLALSYTAAPTAAANASAVRSELTTELGLITTNLDAAVSSNTLDLATLLSRVTGLIRTKAEDNAADEALVLDLLNKEAIGTATVLSGSTASVMIETLNAELLLPNHLKGCLFVITDITNGNEQVRWIASHLSDLDTGYMVITPDEAFTFTPAVGDTIKIYRLARLSPDEADTDPLGVAVPGSYAPGTVGYLIGTNLDVPVSDVAAAAGGDWAITRTFQIAGGAKVPGVRMSLAGVAGKSDTSGSNGIANVKTDDGTYTLRVVVPAGYDDVADAALVISGADSTATVTLTPASTTLPDNPGNSVLEVLCLDETGTPEVSVVIEAQIMRVPSGSTGIVFDRQVLSATSGVDGVATLECIKGATYRVRRGPGGVWQEVKMSRTDTTTIQSFIGKEL